MTVLQKGRDRGAVHGHLLKLTHDDLDPELWRVIDDVLKDDARQAAMAESMRRRCRAKRGAARRSVHRRPAAAL